MKKKLKYTFFFSFQMLLHMVYVLSSHSKTTETFFVVKYCLVWTYFWLKLWYKTKKKLQRSFSLVKV